MLRSGDNLQKYGNLPIERVDLLRRIAHKTLIKTCWNLRLICPVIYQHKTRGRTWRPFKNNHTS